MEVSWSLVFYTLFVGLGMGAFGYVVITDWLGKAERYRLAGSIITLLAMAAGGISSALHLGHVERVANVLGNMDSRISQELILVIVVGVFVILYIALLVAGASDQVRKIVAALGLVAAVILAFMNGLIYVLPSRPAWNTVLWPMLYIASSAVLGLFSMYVYTALRSEEVPVVKELNTWALVAVVVQGVLVIAYIIYLAFAPFQAASRSPMRLIGGDLALIFWLGVVVLGMIIPLWLNFRSRAAKMEASYLTTSVLGLVCTFVGAVAIRVIMYSLGTSIQQFL
ncbi:MAG: polysulfide reductase NrfD [Anaerolineales bacterium]|nr:polysulfide reductase NrfD [Anaerolineales bacterium]